MSASDAAPLPRLGEVFFDVRGESRSMRLSWYADTGVAVLSIWQGSTCTGTFRLPITDLPRMVEALQRGPHARDEGLTGEQPASREPRLPTAAASSRPARGRPSRPELLDADIETGQTTAAIYSPPAEPHPAGYQAEPPLPGYPGEPADVYSGEPPGGSPAYRTGPPPGRRAKPPRRRESPPAPEFPGGAAPGDGDEGLAGDPGEYAGPTAADFTGGYAVPPADFTGEYPAAAPAAEFTGEYAAPATDFTGGYAVPPADFTGEYPAEPPAPDLPDGPAREYSGGHARRSSSGPTRGTSSGQARRGSSRATRASSGGHTGGGSSGQARRGSSGHQTPPPSGYPGEPSPGYPDEPGTALYPGEPADGYPAEEAVTPGYPQDYQDSQDYGRYQDELAATEYGSPARPYVADTNDIGGPYDDPPERRKPRGRRRADHAPDSFPYGPPPADDEPRQRGRYPGRH